MKSSVAKSTFFREITGTSKAIFIQLIYSSGYNIQYTEYTYVFELIRVNGLF